MKNFTDFQELSHIMKTELFTALVGDVLDKMGYYHQFLPQNIKPLDNGMVVFGKAMTVLEADFFCEQSPMSSNEKINRKFSTR